MSHSFIDQIQKKSLSGKLRENVAKETALAIQNLINESAEIPGVGQLICRITAENGEVTVELGMKPAEAALSA